MNVNFLQLFESIFFEASGKDIGVLDFSSYSAGLVNTGAKVVTTEGLFYVKLNQLPEENFFEAEAKDLAHLAQFVEVPPVFGWGRSQGFNFLITEFLDELPLSIQGFEHAGRQLAYLHKQTSPQFGWAYPNFLSSLVQDNTRKSDGINFFIQNRILPVVGYCLMEEKISIQLFKKIEWLCSRLGQYLPDESPSLIHGDLWSGNLLHAGPIRPVFIDPACCYFLRESELAFTRLFGGFPPCFLESYQEAFPLEPGFEERMPLYQLHPLLVHVYLFGGAYVQSVEKILRHFS